MVDSVVADTTSAASSSTVRGKFLARVRDDVPTTLAAVFLVALALAAVFAPLIAPFGPTEIVTPPVQPFGAPHMLGTDELGRDILSRIIFGARASLGVGLVAPLLAMLVGVPWGLLAGYAGGWVDTVSMRVTDGLLAFPALILAMATVAVLGPNLRNIMLAIGVVYIPRFVRLTRGEVLRIRKREFVLASEAVGASDLFTLRRAIFPNVAPVVSVQFTLSFATAILAEAGLSYLGLGTQPPTPSWGSMLAVAQGYLTQAPLYSVVVGLTIFVTVLSVSLLGDALRDAVDPRRRSDAGAVEAEVSP